MAAIDEDEAARRQMKANAAAYSKGISIGPGKGQIPETIWLGNVTDTLAGRYGDDLKSDMENAVEEGGYDSLLNGYDAGVPLDDLLA